VLAPSKYLGDKKHAKFGTVLGNFRMQISAELMEKLEISKIGKLIYQQHLDDDYC